MRAQRAEDEALRERGIAEDARAELRDLYKQFLEREKEIADKAMRIRYGNQIALSPEQLAEAAATTPQPAQSQQETARVWAARQRASALEQFDSYVRRVDNPPTQTAN